MAIFSLYLPIFLSLSLPLSFLLHTFKKYFYSVFFHVFNAFKNSFKTSNRSSSRILARTITDPPPPPSKTMVVDEEINGNCKLTFCTESLGFESIQETRVDDKNEYQKLMDKIEDLDDGDNRNDNRKALLRNSKAAQLPSFPRPLSSLNQKGQASFALVPVRENGRLQLNRVRIKRPEILYASREHGRLKMFLVPDQCDQNLEEVEEEEEPQEEFEVEEKVKEEEEPQEEFEVEEEDEDETTSEVEGEDLWKLNNNKIEGFMRCHHQLVNQGQNNNPQNHSRHHNNLNIYEVITIA